MNRAERSNAVRTALKQKVVPALRDVGFRGTFPHFTRRLENRIDLINFEFSTHGPGLYVNIGRCGPGGVTLANGTTYPPGKVRCHHCKAQRRLGLSWDFDNGAIRSVADNICADILKLLSIQAEPWWQDPSELQSHYQE